MKKFLMLVLLTAGLACDKPVILNHNDTTQHHPDNDITGEWEIRKSVGGIDAFIEYAPGNGNIYKFGGNGDFTFSADGVITNQGKFTLRQGTVAGQWVLELTSTRMGSVTSIKIQLDNNKLVFLPSASCCDIPTVTYSRI